MCDRAFFINQLTPTTITVLKCRGRTTMHTCIRLMQPTRHSSSNQCPLFSKQHVVAGDFLNQTHRVAVRSNPQVSREALHDEAEESAFSLSALAAHGRTVPSCEQAPVSIEVALFSHRYLA